MYQVKFWAYEVYKSTGPLANPYILLVPPITPFAEVARIADIKINFSDPVKSLRFIGPVYEEYFIEKLDESPLADSHKDSEEE